MKINQAGEREQCGGKWKRMGEGGKQTGMWTAKLSKGSCKKGRKITKHRQQEQKEN